MLIEIVHQQNYPLRMNKGRKFFNKKENDTRRNFGTSGRKEGRKEGRRNTVSKNMVKDN